VIAVPAPISAAFIALVALLYAMLLLGFAYGLRAGGVEAGRRRRWTWAAALGLALWLALTAALALSGALRDFGARPPRVFLVIAPAFLGTLLLGLSPWVGRAAKALPGAWIVAAQSFRVPVEAILWLLVAQRALPEIMTFTGRNWDVVTGLSAPLVAWLGFRHRRPARGAVLLWNLLGLALVTNVVTRGILSAPTPFRVFVTDPPNVIIADFPFVWLPCFVVPVAYFLHIVSLRQLGSVR
jgi:hypothetical protein